MVKVVTSNLFVNVSFHGLPVRFSINLPKRSDEGRGEGLGKGRGYG